MNTNYLLQVNEIFPKLSSVKLTLSHLYDDTSTLKQLCHFRNIHTLVLEQPVGQLDSNFKEFLKVKGHQLRKLCLRVHSASLADLVHMFQHCTKLRVFQFFSMIMETSPSSRDLTFLEEVEEQLYLESQYFALHSNLIQQGHVIMDHQVM